MIPGSPEAIADAYERKAYRDGVDARLSGKGLWDQPDQLTPTCDMLFMDGWLWMDQQIEVRELMVREAEPTMH